MSSVLLQYLMKVFVTRNTPDTKVPYEQLALYERTGIHKAELNCHKAHIL